MSEVPSTARGGTGTAPACRLAVRAALTVVALLAPLKFGTVVVSGEITLFPLSGLEWLVGAWPPFLAPVSAGAGLLLAAGLLPWPRRGWRHWAAPGLWALLLLASLLGLVRTTEWDAAGQQLWLLLGAVAFSLAVAWALPHDPRLRTWLLGALCLGTLLSALSAWNQVFAGFAETERFARQQAAAAGVAPNPELLNRLNQGRAFGPFVCCNSLAGHLVLTLPLALWTLWRAAELFHPVRISRPLFLSLGAALLVGALWFSGSRTGLAALAGSVVLALVGAAVSARLWQASCRARLLVTLAAALVLAAGALMLVTANRGRSLSSLGARLEYYRAAVTMFRQQPLTGVGLGEFYPWYMRLKPAGAEETRLPHSMLLGAAAQCGVAAALAAALCLALPLVLGRLAAGRRAAAEARGVWAERLPLLAAQAGLLAWSLHVLLNYSNEIPGTVMLVAALPLLVRDDPGAGAAGGRGRGGWGLAARGGALAVGVIALAALWRWPGERAYQRLCQTAADPAAPLTAVQARAEVAGRLLPQSPYPWMVLARRAEAEEAWTLALAAMREAARRTPHRSGFQLRLALYATRLGEGDMARAAAAQAVLWYPHHREAAAVAERLGVGASGAAGD